MRTDFAPVRLERIVRDVNGPLARLSRSAERLVDSRDPQAGAQIFGRAPSGSALPLEDLYAATKAALSPLATPVAVELGGALTPEATGAAVGPVQRTPPTASAR